MSVTEDKESTLKADDASNIDQGDVEQLSPSQQRKEDHINLCYQGDVTLEGDRGLWSEVQLIHNALPELREREVSLETRFLDRFELKAPLMLTGMTGGTTRAGEINRHIAKVCEELCIPFGLGSMRVLTQETGRQDLLPTFNVKEYAPNVCLIGNLGVNQLRDLGIERVEELCQLVKADVLAIHLNPAMELIQPDQDADRDFTGGYQAIQEACEKLSIPILVKECGCGLSPQVVQRLISRGVQCVDVSGVGGTSWVKLEALRASENDPQSLKARQGFMLADWGIPTAASVMLAAPMTAQVIASGGISTPLQAAKALALGADIVGLARPALQAYLSGVDHGGVDVGRERLKSFLTDMITGIRMITMLTGARSSRDLRDMPKLLGPQLRFWSELGFGGDR